MKKRFLCAFLFLTSALLQAQTFEKAVFTHKTNQKTRTLEVGDRLNVKHLDKGKIKMSTSKLQRVEDEVLYLLDRPGIPLDNVITIHYRDAGLNLGLRISYGIGWLLILVGFVWALSYIFMPFPPVVGWLIGIGLFILISALVVLAIGTHQIRDAGTAWEVKTVVKTAPVQSP